MNPTRLRVLLLEDNPADAELLQNELRRAGFDAEWEQVKTERDFIQRIEADYDLILADYHLPAFDGMRALKIVRSRRDTPFILVSGTIQDEEAAEAIRNGADDYLLKDRLARLGPAVARALEQRRLRADEARAKQALAAAEEKYRVLVETSMDAVIIVDERGVIEYANSALKKIFGYSPKDVAGRQLAMLQPPRLREESPIFRKELDFTENMAGEGPVEAVGLHRDGREFPVEIVFGDMILAGRQRFAFFLRDITERKTQHDRLMRLSRIHAMLSGITTAILRVRDAQQLLEAACRIAVDHGHFGIVWIGRYDAATQEVSPVASSGLEDSRFLEKAKQRIDPAAPQSGGIVARAIRQKSPVYVNDITIDAEAGGERRQEAIRLGYRSVITLPLVVDGEVAAVFSLFAKDSGFFDEGEVELLTELAANVSFALQSMARKERLDSLTTP